MSSVERRKLVVIGILAVLGLIIGSTVSMLFVAAAEDRTDTAAKVEMREAGR